MQKRFSIETANNGAFGVVPFNLLAYNLVPVFPSDFENGKTAEYELQLYYKGGEIITVSSIQLDEKTHKQAVEKLDSSVHMHYALISDLNKHL